MDSILAAFGLGVCLVFPLVAFVASIWIETAKERRRGARNFAAAIRRQLGFEVRVVLDAAADVKLPSGRVVRTLLSERNVLEHGVRRTIRCAALSIGVSDAPPVRITRETVATWIGKLVGFTKEAEIGVPEFDDKFLIKTEPGGPAAETLWRSGRARAEIEGLFDRHGVTLLECADGAVRIAPPLPVDDVRDLGPVLVALDAIAAELDRVKLKVKVLDAVRTALSDRGSPRCAYCHGAVTGDEPDLVACSACATILHEGCWAEHGRCPVLGCGGTRPERGERARV